MKITEKEIDVLLNKKSLDKMTKKELRIILIAVVNEHYNLGIEKDLKTIVKLNKDCIIDEV